MLTVEEIKKKLQPMIVMEVKKATGLHYNTIRKIKIGKTKELMAETQRKLSEYLEAL